MKIFRNLATVLLLAFSFTTAQAASNSNPGLYYGLIPSAAQWNSYFSAKLDYLPGAVNTLPYWDSLGNMISAPVSGDCTAVANAFTCGTLGGFSFASPPPIGSTTPNTIYHTNTVSISAFGTTQGTATPLTTQFNRIVTASATNYGISMMTPARSGLLVGVDNDTAFTVYLYPQTGGQINAAGVNVPLIIAPGGSALLVNPDNLNWDTYLDTVQSFSALQTYFLDANGYSEEHFAATGAVATGNPAVSFKTSRGTLAAPTATQTSDLLGNLDFWGYGTAMALSASVSASALSVFSGTNLQSQLNFSTTAPASATPAQVFNMSNGGANALFGVNASGTFTGTYTDGTVVDYTTGNGRISVGASDTLSIYNGGIAGAQLAQFGTGVGTATQTGVTSIFTGTSAATSAIYAFQAAAGTAAAAFTSGTVIDFYGAAIAKGAGSTITNAFGFYSADQTQGTNNYGFYSGMTAGTNKWGFYNGGGALNYFGTATSYFSSISTAPTNNLLISGTAPTISSGFGTGASIPFNNGTAAFEVNVGTGGTATNGVIGLPTSAHGWTCAANDETTTSATVFMTKQIASTTASVTVANFNTSAAQAAWAASDVLHLSCFAY